LIGLLLTIFSTFVPVSLASWSAAGLSSQKLGITYQIGAVLLTGCLGGKNAGLLAQVAYIFLGLTWLPVFAQGGGMGYLKEASFGYILGFMPGAWLCGWLASLLTMKLIPHRLSGCVCIWYSEFVSIWYSFRRPHRNSALPPDYNHNRCA